MADLSSSQEPILVTILIDDPPSHEPILVHLNFDDNLSNVREKLKQNVDEMNKLSFAKKVSDSGPYKLAEIAIEDEEERILKDIIEARDDEGNKISEITIETQEIILYLIDTSDEV